MLTGQFSSPIFFLMESLDEIRELTTLSMLLRIFVSIVLGAILGIERGLKNRPAGLRTYILVCMGSCIIMLTNQYVYAAYKTGDPVRMAAQVVSGIGFLGAGSIIVTKQNQIRGLTTAAGLWASSAVGLAIGIGLYEVAIVGAFAILIILRVLNHWDAIIRHRTKTMNIYIELKNRNCIGEFIHYLKLHGLYAENVQNEKAGISSDAAFIFTLKSSCNATHDDMIAILEKSNAINYFEEL